jgi:hypothetical protein
MENAQNEPKRGRGRPRKNHIGALEQRSSQRVPQRQIEWRARRTLDEIEESGRYFIDPAIIPDGMDYQFKALTVMGEEMREHQIRLARDGAWDPVPASRHPDLMGKYLDKNDPAQAIIIGGQILMERPKIYSQQAEAENRQKARDAVTGQFKSLGLGEKLGKGFEAMKPQVKRDYSVQAVPDDDVADAVAL